jgi:hypothetical protein
MMEDKKLKKAIQKLKLDEPTDSFAVRVMSQIEASQELSLKLALTSMLKKKLASNPSDSFTAGVMSQIMPKAQSAVMPVISRKAWYWVAGIVTIILSIALISSTRSTTGLTNRSFWPSSVIPVIGEFSQQMITYLVALSSLFLIDYFLRRRRDLSCE